MRNSKIVSSLITAALVAITLGAAITPAQAAGNESSQKQEAAANHDGGGKGMPWWLLTWARFC